MTNDESGEADQRQPLRHQDFAIGQEFETEMGTWRCTDVGTQTIVVIKVSAYDDPSWFNGPPYAVLEVVFDEYDLDSCWPTQPSKNDTTRGGSGGHVDDKAPNDGATGDDGGTGGKGDVHLLHVDGIAGSAARLRVTARGVELTFLDERRPGFLAWLTEGAAGHAHRLMHEHERESDVDEMVAEWLAKDDASGPDGAGETGRARTVGVPQPRSAMAASPLAFNQTPHPYPGSFKAPVPQQGAAFGHRAARIVTNLIAWVGYWKDNAMPARYAAYSNPGEPRRLHSFRLWSSGRERPFSSSSSRMAVRGDNGEHGILALRQPRRTVRSPSGRDGGAIFRPRRGRACQRGGGAAYGSPRRLT